MHPLDLARNVPHEAETNADPNTDLKATAIIKRMVGDGNIPLNTADSAIPADVQSPVHLAEAVAFALSNNFEVRAAKEKSTGAYWDKMGAYSQFLPSIEYDVDSGAERSAPASINDSNGNRVVANVHHRRDRSFSIRQPLIDLGIIADILSQGDKEDIASIDQLDTKEGVAYDTISAYLSLIQSQLSIRLADDYKQYLDNLSARMKARVDSGGAASADLDRVRGRAANADAAKIEASGEFGTNIQNFKRLTKIMPAEIVIPDTLVPLIPATSQNAMEKALKSNPTYLSSMKKADVAMDDRNKSLSALLPRLSAQYTDVYSFNAGASAEGNPVDGIYPTQKTQAIMLVAQWTLNGGTAITGGFSGEAKMREMTLRSMDVRTRMEEAVQSGYTAINAAAQRQSVLEKTVQADENVVKAFEEQYAGGKRSLFDLLDAYEQLYNARLNLVRVVIAHAKAAYAIHRQIGDLAPSIMSTGIK